MTTHTPLREHRVYRQAFLTFLLAFGGLFISAGLADAAAVSWDGGGDGTTWEDGTNWDGDSVPDTGDDVTIDANVSLTISGADTVTSLTLGNVGGTTTPTLTFNYAAMAGSPLTISGDLIVYDGSTITHTANTTTQAYDISIDVGGNMTLDDGAQINMDELGYQGGVDSSGSDGSGPGAGTSQSYSGGGGSHGGWSGRADETGSDGAAPYGDTFEPTTIGSGGAGGNDGGTDGGHGGGGVKLVIGGTFLMDGTISANGGDGVVSGNSQNGGGGGAGGGVNIITSSFSCTDVGSDGCDDTPAITANGGIGPDGAGRDGGGGSGGRIYVQYETTTMQTPDDYETIFSALGGDADANEAQGGSANRASEDGWSGTVLILDTDTDLVEYTDADAWMISGFHFQDGDENNTVETSWHFNDLYISGPGNGTVNETNLADLVFETATSILQVDGTLFMKNIDMTCDGVATLSIEGNDVGIGGSAGSTDVENITGCGDVLISVVEGVNTPWDGLTISADSLDIDIDENESLTLTDSSITVTDATKTAFTMDDDAMLILGSGDSANPTTIVGNMDLLLSELTIYDGSSLSADGLGCTGRAGSGANGNGPDGSNVCTVSTTGYGDAGSYAGGGAGHGGAGGTTVDGAIAGATYDTPSTPSGYRFGSGGAGGEGGSTYGGDGGGYIKLDIVTLTVNGSISANGTVGDDNGNNGAGGGSGGSIWIDTQELAGTASATTAITANGGGGGDATGSGRGGGGGGGGLVYIDYAYNTSSFGASLTDANTAAGGDKGTGSIGDGTDGGDGVLTASDTVPVMIGASYRDLDSDGTIDAIVMEFNEAVTVGGTVADSRFTLTSPTGATGFGGSLSGNASVAGDVFVLVTIASAEGGETSASGTVQIAYDDNSDDATDKLEDSGGNIVQSFGATTADDLAGPVFLSSSPADGDTGVATDAEIVFTLSEPIDTGTFAYTCCGAATDPGLSGAWSVGDTVYTVTPTAAWIETEDVIMGVSAADDLSGNTFNGGGGATNPFTFTIASSSSGRVTSSTPAESITAKVDQPNGGLTYQGGNDLEVSWTITGNAMDSALLEYTTDRGDTYTTIQDGLPKSGTVLWSLPNEDLSQVKVKVTGLTSSGSSLATDESNAYFAITKTQETDTAEPTPDPIPIETEGEVMASMETVEGEIIDLYEGHVFKGETLPGVYLVKNGTRYVFPSESVFFSYYSNFDDVIQVKDDQLRALSLSGRVTMAPGRMIKIQSDNRVFQVQQDGTISHIPDEATAISLYGDTWNQQITDINVVFWGDYAVNSVLASVGL